MICVDLIVHCWEGLSLVHCTRESSILACCSGIHFHKLFQRMSAAPFLALAFNMTVNVLAAALATSSRISGVQASESCSLQQNYSFLSPAKSEKLFGSNITGLLPQPQNSMGRYEARDPCSIAAALPARSRILHVCGTSGRDFLEM